MKIVFCTLHVRRSTQAISLAAGCLASALPEPLSQTSTLVDAFPDQSDQEILTMILQTQPDVVAFPVYVWNRLRLIVIAKKLHKQAPHIRLIAGGPEATGDANGLLAAAPWTALVHGEGEAAFSGLINALAENLPAQPLPGVSWVSQENIFSGPECCPHDLDKAPSPWLTGALKPEASGGVLWEVARGCAFSCDYCFEARGHGGVRGIERKRLEEELALFVAAGVTQVWVLDSTFNHPPQRGIALLELLLEHAPHMHYHLEAKADFIDRRTVALLSQLNCSVQLGLQSIHEQVLKAVHRPLGLDTLTEKVRLLAAEGIIYGFDLIYGLPQDNYAGFRDSLDTVLSFAPNHIHIFPLSILPGTRLAQQRDRYGIEAQSEPPYELTSSSNWTVEEMELCRRLSAAVDLFYNSGRAVAFFPAIMHALQIPPSELFEDFFKWVLQQEGVEYHDLMLTDRWAADDVYRMLQGYLCSQLERTGQGHLTSVFLDLLCYHFHYAETILGEELLPPQEPFEPQTNLWETPWQRSSKCRLVPFAYEILDLLEVEEMQLDEFASLFRPVGSVALFMRRDNEVFCESLSEEMLKLLRESNSGLSPKDIFAGSLSQATGEELVEFAVYEGLLQPVQ
ncbi:DUF4080 domain-containing protein [Deltaproteobacteria bacterium IMCC39524]|nr:DUF4080 domain-containing protein [Deltaproteobacteria bacterium IMCC39524]